jgi:hypothetical protein
VTNLSRNQGNPVILKIRVQTVWFPATACGLCNIPTVFYIRTRALNDINREAMSVLTEALGVANTLRFLSQFTAGYGNYTEEKEKIFENMSIDDIVKEIKEMRKADRTAGYIRRCRNEGIRI